MCQLLGMSFNRAISPIGPFSKLVSNSVLHPDGWGVGYYSDESKRATIFKESIPAHESQLVRFLIRYKGFYAKNFVAHIRNATRGTVTLDNTHPFNRYYDGREYLFTHNGSLSRSKRLSRLYFKPIGDTDSERAFCYLLTQLRRYEIKRVLRDHDNGYGAMDFQKIHEILQDINDKAVGSFNCIFSDGEYLFCYKDLQEARNLFWMKCQKYLSIKRDRKNLINKKSAYRREPDTQGYIVATEPSINGSWQSFTGGQLMVFRNGHLEASLT